MNDWIQAGIQVAGGGAVVALVNALVNRRRMGAETVKINAEAKRTEADAKKIDAEAKKVIAEAESVAIEAAKSMISTMRDDLRDMHVRVALVEERLSTAERLVNAYRRRVEYLTDLLRLHNIKAEDWNPPS